LTRTCHGQFKQTTKKANDVKYFLQCNMNKCPQHIKSSCYKALIKPILEYAAIVWSPHTHKCYWENVQRRAGWFVTNNYSRYASVIAMLSNLKWPTLHRLRNEQKAIMLYKIINHHINADSFLILNLILISTTPEATPKDF